ncbi:MAG: response regulator [Ignavibacteriae bacterium]|nr:response regulator [Ignavibacteria bacterium]MBI3363991.1 response regulator [Ignavibacteriota bacterium]
MIRGKAPRKLKTVLFIDDELAWLQAVKMAVDGQSFKVMTADSGEEALKQLRRAKPDLIVSDVRMPAMNGFDLFEKVRSYPKFQGVPYVFMSSLDDFDAKHIAKQIGADAYIERPLDIDEIKKVVLDLLIRFRRR